MFTPNKKDIYHKLQLFNLLNLILKDTYLVKHLMFKGGTYASLRGVLDRFSVDLDFDLPHKSEKDTIRNKFHEVFDKLNLTIKDESMNYLQFYLRYEAKEYQRNTLKLEINDSPSKYNRYEKVNLLELNRFCNGHTLDTMLANKLLAAKGRYEKNGKLSGRDFYDINYFLKLGIKANRAVVEDTSGTTYDTYIKELTVLIADKLTIRLLNEDLNPLLHPQELNKKAPLIKDELIFLLKEELKTGK